jgi:putative hydrolase of the HAD superfamily
MTESATLAIVFDATGTLIQAAEPVGEVYHRIALQHGVDLPAWRIQDAFRRVLRHAPTRGVEGDGIAGRRAQEIQWWVERIRQTFQATDSTARFDDFPRFAQALFDAYRAPGAWHVCPGIHGVLQSLRDRVIPLGVISNFDHRLPDILEGLGIIDFFDFIEIPSTSGRIKPDARLFASAAGRFDRPLSGLTYVGDDPPERLARIAAQGVRVVDIRDCGERSLLDRLFSAD